MPETEDCPLCDGDDQECRYCGVPRIKMPETERRIGKRKLSSMVKANAAALLECMELDALLGDELHDQICNDHDLLEFVEQRRNAIAKRVRNL